MGQAGNLPIIMEKITYNLFISKHNFICEVLKEF